MCIKNLVFPHTFAVLHNFYCEKNKFYNLKLYFRGRNVYVPHLVILFIMSDVYEEWSIGVSFAEQ